MSEADRLRDFIYFEMPKLKGLTMAKLAHDDYVKESILISVVEDFSNTFKAMRKKIEELDKELKELKQEMKVLKQEKREE